MNRILLALLPLALIAGFAIADEHTSETEPPSYGVECFLNADDSTHATPGKMLQHIRENDTVGRYDAGGNMVDWLENFDGYGAGEATNPGDWLRRNCDLNYD